MPLSIETMKRRTQSLGWCDYRVRGIWNDWLDGRVKPSRYSAGSGNSTSVPSLLPSIHVIDLAPDGIIHSFVHSSIHSTSYRVAGRIYRITSLRTNNAVSTRNFNPRCLIAAMIAARISWHGMTGSFRYSVDIMHTIFVQPGSGRIMSISVPNSKLLN